MIETIEIPCIGYSTNSLSIRHFVHPLLVPDNPKLEALEIDVWELIKPPPGNVKVEGSCRLDHLKSAKIISRDCTPRNSYSIMLQLIKLILSCSPILKVLTFQVNVPSEEKINIDKEELLQYHRASANAKIIFEKMQFDEEV